MRVVRKLDASSARPPLRHFYSPRFTHSHSASSTACPATVIASRWPRHWPRSIVLFLDQDIVNCIEALPQLAIKKFAAIDHQ